MQTAFEYNQGIDVTHTRIETMDSLDGLFAYADNKGNAYVAQLDNMGDKLTMQDVQTQKVKATRNWE